MTVDQVIAVIQNFGLAVSIIIVLGIAIRSVMIWAAEKFEKWVEPVFTRHMELIGKLEQALIDQTVLIRKMIDECNHFRKSGGS